jgi:multisubunit Na+/H+ antiporter MnhE subunit
MERCYRFTAPKFDPVELAWSSNSVYRFFAWGTIPIGTLLGGTLVSVLQSGLGREMAFRSVYFTASALGFGLFLYAIRVLTEAKIERARSSVSHS